jgi:hypothetical protein
MNFGLLDSLSKPEANAQNIFFNSGHQSWQPTLVSDDTFTDAHPHCLSRKEKISWG